MYVRVKEGVPALQTVPSDPDERLDMYEDDERYLRRNIWGMQLLREALLDLGMAYDTGFPTWPEPSVFEPGIPVHKLCSNDGWHVTAVECLSALIIWERRGKPMPEEFMDDVIPFLQAAARRDGFEVW